MSSLDTSSYLFVAPCPFCHNQKVGPVVLDNGRTFIECEHCHATGPLLSTKIQAIENWNLAHAGSSPKHAEPD